MAEFKIGRLRVTWAGPWAGSKTYNRDDVVGYNGKTYICLVPHTSNADFYADLYHTNLTGASVPYWSLSVEGKKFLGAWQPNTPYSLGNLVNYGGTVYACTTAHTSGSQTITLANWTTYTLSSNWHPAWTVNTVYGVGDVVKYGGIVYKCNTGHVSASSVNLGLEADQNSWSVFFSGTEYKGAWAQTTHYKLNDLVKEGPEIWICTTPHTSASTFNPANFTVWLPGIEFSNTWDGDSTYQAGDVVVYGGYTYVSTASNNLDNVPPGSGSWTLLTTGYEVKGEFTSTSYKVGDVVTRNGRSFVAIADNVSASPEGISVTTSYVAAGSSGTTVVLANPVNPYVTGMILSGAGLTLGQTIVSITSVGVSNTTVVLDRAPDGTLVDGQFVTVTGVNSEFWNLLIPGTAYQGYWNTATQYVIGDVVVYKNSTYYAISNNSSVNPANDTAHLSWVDYVQHFRKNSSTTFGDLQTYTTGPGYSRVGIGQTDYTLRSTNNQPTWSFINYVPNVFYVSDTNGIDRSDYGSTWDHPLRTIKYACDKVGAGLLYPTVAALIKSNKEFIVAETYQYMLNAMATSKPPFTPSSVFDESKTKRDIRFAVDAIAYDLARGGNSHTVSTALSYFADGSTSTFYSTGVTAKIAFIIAALQQVSSLITSVIIGQQPLVNYQSLNNVQNPITQTFLSNYTPDTSVSTAASALMNIIITALTNQSTSQLPVPNTGIGATIYVKTGTYNEITPIVIPENVAVIGDELRGVIVQPSNIINQIVVRTDSSTNLFTVETTAGMYDKCPIQFEYYLNDAGVKSTLGGVSNGVTYYVKGSSITSNQFSVYPAGTFSNLTPDVTVSSQGAGALFTVSIDTSNNTYTVTNVSNGADNKYLVNDTLRILGSHLGGQDGVNDIVITVTESAGANQQIAAFTFTGSPTVLALTQSVGKMNAYGGNALNNMFLMRNATGLRNMTLTGLLGTLTDPDAQLLSRPTGGAYVSLDPGTGPNDTSAWITRRSPYVQNVTTYGIGCVGAKIDGSLHNGGNKSIVANDFTQVLSDGIGVWCTGSGALTELISVFTYYDYAGYFAEAGGRIRAANGNSSYGTFGVVATGYDTTETPITGNVFNQSLETQASVQSAFGVTAQLLKLNFSNAGSAYNQSTTNLLSNSNNFIGTGWSQDGNLTVLKNSIAPSGLTEGWLLTGTTSSSDSAYVYQDVTINPAGGTYTSILGTTVTGGGSGARFDVTVKNDSYYVSVTSGQGGSGYVIGNTISIAGASVGGVTGVNDILITVGSLTATAINSITYSGTVPAGSNQSYILSVHVKKGTAASVDLQAVFSGTSSVTSGINYNFDTNTVTPSVYGTTGFMPVSYGAQVISSSGWYRLWFSVQDNVGTNSSLRFKLYPRGYSGIANTYSIVYGSQIEISNTGSYSPLYTPSFYLETSGSTRYSAYANYQINGAGTGVAPVGDELRSAAVFQGRIIDNGQIGGAGYLTASNNAQGGDAQSIVVAQSDTNTISNYQGMRIFINSGTGAGQYGYISSYNTGTKTIQVLKESFDAVNVTNTTSSGNLLTLAAGTDMSGIYVNQAVQFTPKFTTTLATSTSLAQMQATATVGGTTNTVTVATTQGLAVNMPVSFTGSTFGQITTNYQFYIAAIVDNVTIKLSNQAFGTVWQLVTATGNLTMSYPAYNNYITCASTTNMLPNLPVQFTGSALGGVTVGSIYYINDVINPTTFTISPTTASVTATATSGSNTVTVNSSSSLVPLNPIVFSGTTFGNVVANTKYYISKIVDNVTIKLASSLTYVDCTATAASTSLITCASTSGFVVNNPIKFTGTTLGGIIVETTYYILAINDGQTFTISQTVGGSAVALRNDSGIMVARTATSDFALTGSSGTMTGTTTGNKTTLTYGSGAMNATFSTALYGGVSGTTVYYIKTIDTGNRQLTVSTSQGGSAVTLTTGTGSMNLGAVGWDHINPGTPIQSVLDYTSVYYIEPRTQFTDPAFSQSSASAVTLASGNWNSIASGNGYFFAIPSTGSVAARSTDGSNWTQVSMPSSSGTYSSIAYGNNYWVAISSGANLAVYSNSNGTAWKTSSVLPATTTWSKLVYGNGLFVAIAPNTNSAYSTNFGKTWSAGTGLANNSWSGLAYGAGRFVAVASGTRDISYSTDGINWTSVVNALPASSTWASIVYGNGRFVAISSASSIGSAYSFDGITWYSSNIYVQATHLTYGQGTFLALNSGSTSAYVSEDGIEWRLKTVSSSTYNALAFGYTSVGAGVFTTLTDGNAGSAIYAGIRAKGRAVVISNAIAVLSMWEPGSNYTSVPSVTFTDPNVTSLVSVLCRTSNGVLGNPTFVNRGSGYNTTSTTVSCNGNGYADTYQTGYAIIMNNLTALPQVGSDITIAGDSTVYKVTTSRALFGTTAPSFEAVVELAPEISVAKSPANGAAVSVRQKYSQVRLTNHDFLNVGYGNIVNSNYPNYPAIGYASVPANQTVEANYGRVFYTSTDQDGNFKVGNLFGVQQATGIVTLSATQFGITGLQTLSLGGIAVGGSSVTITQFSTDPTFVANSDSIVPTQKAIKAYLTSRLNQGGANTATGQLIAGTVTVGGVNKIGSNAGITDKVNVKMNIAGSLAGVDGNMAALDFFMRHGSHRSSMF